LQHSKLTKSLVLFSLIIMTMLAFLPQTVAAAEVKEIISEGTYCMGDGETPTVAEQSALLAAKRTALEQAGTYVESYSATKNYQLTADEVKVLASGIMEVTVLDKKRTVDGSNITFWVKIKAEVSTDKIEDMAAKVKEMSIAEDYKKLQESYDKSQQEIGALQKQLSQTSNEKEKVAIRSQIADSENGFQANSWLDQGNRLMANGQCSQAIQAYTQAIAMKPHLGRAYLRRGMSYTTLGRYQDAIADFDMATAINPKLTLAYVGKGHAYDKLGYRHEAVEAYRIFIDNASSDQQRYVEQARRRIWMLLHTRDTYPQNRW